VAHVLIAGAGIGGLTAACALRRAGFEVTLFERTPELRPVGAGITMQTNAMLAFARLGLVDAVAAAGSRLQRAEIRTWDGRLLQEAPARRVAQALGAPVVGIHRARLQRVLLDALDGAHLVLGAAVSGVETASRGVGVRLSDGRTAEGDLLVGADGLRSVVRAALHGEAEPSYAGYTSWRGICPNGGRVPEGLGRECWGAGRRFGFLEIGHDEVYWFATRDAPPGGGDPPAGAAAALARELAEWAPPVASLLAATPEEAVVRTDICDRPPLAGWGRGRVTLLGDAAHPMTPNLGQGGCQAVEDAVVLAERLARAAELEHGLRQYEHAREARTRWFVEQSRRVGRVAQARGRLSCFLRDTLTRWIPESATERQLRTAFAFSP
jgi:2-polyprenyl-6-methoxyphenol hydroxylase-like FAD-dependent oxidoreductase